MSDKTGIEWTDSTWNPTTGCDQVSPGCDNCYALTLAKRLKAMGSPRYQVDGDPRTSGPGFGFTMHADALDQPLRWTRPRRIFVNSMSDLFHSDMDTEFLAQVFAVMALAPQHTFQVLTKRPGRMRSLLSQSPGGPSESFVQRVKHHMWLMAGEHRAGLAGWHHRIDQKHEWWPLDNVWLGTSVEDQKRADLRIPALLETPAAVRFLSMEPLLGPVDLRQAGAVGRPDWEEHDRNRGRLIGNVDWVIVGGESGRGARPMHPEWARELRDQCTTAGIAFLFKQWGEWQDGSAGPEQRGEDHIIVRDGRHEPAADHWARDDRDWWTSDLIRDRAARRPGSEAATFISRVGRKAAGRELDGRTWDEYPRGAG